MSRPTVSSPTLLHTHVPGAHYSEGLTTFAVWAPVRQSVELVCGDDPSADIRRLTRDPNGYWSGVFDDLPPGSLYRYRLDGDDSQRFPDPASRFQPHGVHGPSQVVDPAAFAWTDRGWRAPTLQELTIYELHVGTFTPQGTFTAVIERLPELARLGVTAIELMPVGDFAGDRNWGYDGVAIFAPARCYGTPDDLRRLVDAAHRHGLAVMLDVVYNHFGPDGAYLFAFSPYYFSDRHESPWGRGLNFDGPHSEHVRRFFIENALHWVRDFHVDALRLDATHAIIDEGPRHFLAELTTTLHEEAATPVVVIAEDHRNLAQMLQPTSRGGLGLDGVWADDFHHQARVHTAHDREGYYADFTGSLEDLATTLRQGWFYTGQRSPRTGEERGSDPAGLDPAQFVICLQNHDQIGNRFDGARLHHEIDLAVYRALSVLLLVSPHTPLLFMGQEWAASTPFQFFTDHHDELGRQVTAGRRAEFAAFTSFGHGSAVPDPQEVATFERSKLKWDEREVAPHRGVLRLYEQLLHLRRTHPALRAGGRDSLEVSVLDAHTLAVRRTNGADGAAALAVVRLSGEGETTVRIEPAMRDIVLTTEDADVTDDRQPIRVEDGRLTFRRPGAIICA